MRKRITNVLALITATLAMPVALFAEEAAAEPTLGDQVTSNLFRIDNLWICIAAALVFMMHLGFSTLESGLCQAKNTTNILFKNVMIICIGVLTYAICGFNLMYPCGDWTMHGVFGFAGFGIPGVESLGDPSLTTAAGYELDMTTWADFFFQAMFAATAATIISGCVAERIKLLPFLIFATIYVAFLYPWLGSWHWGAGWLYEMGFYDFAGSTLVHSVGGWGGLAAIIVLGPRKGKYGEDGSVRPIVGHNLPLAAIGVFLLWFGWFGFNGGSVLSAAPELVSYVLVTTAIAAACGGLTAGAVSWVMTKKPDLTMALNGILAGLVGITASADSVGIWVAVFLGVSCGVIVYFSVLFFDKLKLDDPVGALSVHLVCGIWATIFVALGSYDAREIENAAGETVEVAVGTWGVQIVGVLAYGAAAFIFALVTALIVKAVFGFRVSEEEELEGLDLGEHGQVAYHALEAR